MTSIHSTDSRVEVVQPTRVSQSVSQSEPPPAALEASSLPTSILATKPQHTSVMGVAAALMPPAPSAAVAPGRPLPVPPAMPVDLAAEAIAWDGKVKISGPSSAGTVEVTLQKEPFTLRALLSAITDLTAIQDPEVETRDEGTNEWGYHPLKWRDEFLPDVGIELGDTVIAKAVPDPLRFAAASGNSGALSLWLSMGENPDGNTPNWSPLFTALACQKSESVRLLCRAGANVDQVVEGWSVRGNVLKYAVSLFVLGSGPPRATHDDTERRDREHLERIRLLLNAGAKADDSIAFLKRHIAEPPRTWSGAISPSVERAGVVLKFFCAELDS